MKLIGLILKLVPAIIQAVFAVEAAVGAGKGQSKKEVVLAAIKAGAESAEAFDEKHIAAIGSIIDATVVAANKTGLFATGGTVAAQ